MEYSGHWLSSSLMIKVTGVSHHTRRYPRATNYRRVLIILIPLEKWWRFARLNHDASSPWCDITRVVLMHVPLLLLMMTLLNYDLFLLLLLPDHHPPLSLLPDNGGPIMTSLLMLFRLNKRLLLYHHRFSCWWHYLQVSCSLSCRVLLFLLV